MIFQSKYSRRFAGAQLSRHAMVLAGALFLACGLEYRVGDAAAAQMIPANSMPRSMARDRAAASAPENVQEQENVEVPMLLLVGDRHHSALLHRTAGSAVPAWLKKLKAEAARKRGGKNKRPQGRPKFNGLNQGSSLGRNNRLRGPGRGTSKGKGRTRGLYLTRPNLTRPKITGPKLTRPGFKLPGSTAPGARDPNPQRVPGNTAGNNGSEIGTWPQPGTSTGGKGSGGIGTGDSGTGGYDTRPPTGGQGGTTNPTRPGTGLGGFATIPPHGRRPPATTPPRFPGKRPPGWPSGRTPPPGIGNPPTGGKTPPRRPPLQRPAWRAPRPGLAARPVSPSAPIYKPPTRRTPQGLTPPPATPPVRQAAPDREPLYRAREVIVFVDGKTKRSTIAALARANNLKIEQIVPSRLLGRKMVRFSYRGTRRVERVIRSLRRNRAVVGVQPNFIYRMKPVVRKADPQRLPSLPSLPLMRKKSGNKKAQMESRSAARVAQRRTQNDSAMAAKEAAPAAPAVMPGAAGGAAATTPSDRAGSLGKKSWFNPVLQYGLVKVGAARAHNFATGRRVKIAVIDTAIDKTHPALKGAIVGSYNALDGAVNGAASAALRPLAHGTSIAGIIAGRKQVSGVAPNAQILEIVAFDRARQGQAPESSSFSLLRGIEWAFDNGARVFNMSFSGPHDVSLARLINKAYAKGAIITAAAGNGGAGAPPSYPAAYRNVIAVTATDAGDRLYAKANHGGYVTLAAPGVDILAPALHGGFSYASGTSFAAAHVSGVIALLLDIDPGLKEAIVRRAITQSARDLGAQGRDPLFGAGLVDAGLAMQQLRGRAR